MEETRLLSCRRESQISLGIDTTASRGDRAAHPWAPPSCARMALTCPAQLKRVPCAPGPPLQRCHAPATHLGPGRHSSAWSATNTRPSLTAGSCHHPGRAANSDKSLRARQPPQLLPSLSEGAPLVAPALALPVPGVDVGQQGTGCSEATTSTSGAKALTCRVAVDGACVRAAQAKGSLEYIPADKRMQRDVQGGARTCVCTPWSYAALARCMQHAARSAGGMQHAACSAGGGD